MILNNKSAARWLVSIEDYKTKKKLITVGAFINFVIIIIKK